jgi:hypothetical protein
MLPDDCAAAAHEPEPGLAESVRYSATVEDGIGVQVGDRNVQYLQLPARSKIAWPVRVGVIPLAANCFQQRAVLDHVTGGLLPAPGPAPVTSQVRVLSGPGGMGKTQIAAQYATEQWATGTIDLLVWVSANSRESVLSGYADTAACAIGPERTNPLRTAEQLLTWLAQTTRRWLVVLDDLQDPSDLARLWPPTSTTGQVLVTTRRRDAALGRTDRTIIDVGTFTPDEASAYLHATLTGHPRLLDEADELARDLGFLPLALAQVAAYLLDRDLTCAEYRGRLADQRTKLTDLLPGPGDLLPDDHRDTLAATWSLSLGLADRIAPAGIARPLLVLAALLNPNGIPAMLFTTPVVLRHLTSILGSDVTAVQALDALYIAHRLNLATVGGEASDRTVRVHALVQRAIRETTPDAELAAAARICADALMLTWPEVERDAALAQALRSNTDALQANAADHLWEPRGHDVLFRAGTSLGRAGLQTAAIAYHENLCAVAGRYLGPDHPQTLAARYELAHWRGEAGDHIRAVSELMELLPEHVRVLGPDHAETLGLRHSILHWKGQFDPIARTAAAEDLLPDVLRVFGPDDPRTLRLRLDFARWLRRSGDLVAAADALDAVLADQRAVLGQDHPALTKTRYNIAMCRGETGHPIEAVTALENLLADELRVFGTSRPIWQLEIRAEIARWRKEAGDPAGAVEDFEELLTDQIRILGRDHPSTCYTRRKLETWRKQP